MNPTLLVELFTEELPPKALNNLGNAFASALAEHLTKLNYLATASQVKAYASPRRLAVQITDVATTSPDQAVQEKLLPAAIGLDANGQATAPLLKKLKALGLEHVDVASLEKISDGKQEQLVYKFVAPGKNLSEGLQAALEYAITKLPIPKVMGYQRPTGETVHFVRPAHRLLALHGSEVVPLSILGLQSGRETLGHRFLSAGVLVIDQAEHYEQVLETQGKVIADFAKRKHHIAESLAAHAAGDRVVQPEALLDEVTALVEWPVVYEGSFDPAFLAVPQECLILTMQANQKYFAVTDQTGKMKNRFLLVSNLQTETPSAIIGGNERVLRARLADARFFFEQDRKKPLASRVDGLANVVYHNQLGTQKDRIHRLVELAGLLAKTLGADESRARRAALLIKADLITDMVGEFPELQGVMGMYYARHDGEPGDIPAAVEEHYHPRFAGDSLPATELGTVVALSDKLETLVGIYSIGLVPTGDRDPFALRRHALGVIRMLVEKSLPLSLAQLLPQIRALFAQFAAVKDADAGLLGFIEERLRGYLKDQGYTSAEVSSVLSNNQWQLNTILQRLQAVREFVALPESQALAAANKRISNILKKSEGTPRALNAGLLAEDGEKSLANAVTALAPRVESAFAQGQYTEALTALAAIKPQVDAFFDHVMVMAEDLAVRQNRIALLAQLHRLMNQVADLSELAV